MIGVWLDTANPPEIAASDATGFTTNPKLWREQNQWPRQYDKWEAAVLRAANGRTISLEVTASDLVGMRTQAERILGLGENVYVKIPIRTPAGESTAHLIASLERVNATCCFSVEHVYEAHDAGARIISIFAGRIADQGINPEPPFGVQPFGSRLLWASAREVYNVVQAESAGADIITLSPELYAKWKVMGQRSLNEACLDTVREFCQ